MRCIATEWGSRGTRPVSFVYNHIMARPERAYLSVIQWPSSYGEEEAAALVADVLNLDLYSARQRVRHGVPGIISRIQSLDAPRIVQHLTDAGTLAFAASESDIAALGRPIRARGFAAINSSQCSVETFDHGRLTFPTTGIFLLVRGSPSVTEQRPPAPLDHADKMAIGGHYMIGGVAGAAMAYHEASTRRGTTRTTRTELLDIHLRSGEWIRCDGTRFSFDILGKTRGPADSVNMDTLTWWLAKAAPNAIPEANFQQFKCPLEFIRTAMRSMSANATAVTTNAPAFDFYSVWSCLLYRTLSPDWKSPTHIPQ